MARDRDNFVISDVDSFYFSGEGGEYGRAFGEDLTSYIYTDRPIYRPAQRFTSKASCDSGDAKATSCSTRKLSA
jgi:uncharacterized protein YfaS (alpha-2-macroglobulin family)